MSPELVERVYARYSGVYDHVFGPILNSSRTQAILDLPITASTTVLEVGVGTGLTLPLYPRNCKLTGIDFSAEMLEKAKARARDEGLNHVKLQEMDAQAMTFADNSFDLVVAAYVVTAVPDYKRLMSEMIRVCRPGGRVVMVNHFVSTNPVWRFLERLVSPLCHWIGFRSDLSLEQVLDGQPLRVQGVRNSRPFGNWKTVTCTNEKPAAQ
jgi:phosphatidylethanolamine/phosphatidyl-N-methylethanolamine N-methyltransferase